MGTMKDKLVEVIRQARENNSGCKECDEKDSLASCALMSSRYGCYPSVSDEELATAILSRLELDRTELISTLVGLWYRCLIEHHKDKDCHWYIGTHYKYSGEVNYYVEHWGYINGDHNEEFKTFKEAEDFLIETLIKNIREEAQQWIDSEDEYITKEQRDRLKIVLKELSNAQNIISIRGEK